MKKLIRIGLIFFLAGILVAELLGEEFFSGIGFLERKTLLTYAALRPEPASLFGSVLWIRGRAFLLLLLLCMTPLKKFLGVGATFIFGWSGGFLVTACVIMLGWIGIPLSVAAVLPHGILYVLAGILIVRFRNRYHTITKKNMLPILAESMLIFILFLAGCLLETVLSAKLIYTILSAIS